MKIYLTPSPHDAVFKQFLKNPETARDFFYIHLPVALQEKCNLDTLALTSESYIEENLRAHYSDVVYSLKTNDNKEGYAYIILEHQSTPDKHMAFRLMRYSISIMQRHFDTHKKIPFVIPLMFYHGETSPYPYSMNWMECFDNPDLAKHLYSNAFPLVDITAIPDEEIMTHKSVAMLELVQKHIRNRDLLELLEPMIKLILTHCMTEQQTKSMVEYMIQAGETHDPDQFIERIKTKLPLPTEDIMTVAEYLEQKGRMKEREIMAISMLNKKIDIDTIMDISGFSKLDLEKIKNKEQSKED